jgi:DNA helicase-2/ATP-dependent DNA helicase PcrA
MWEVLASASKYGFRAGTLEAIERFVQMIKSFSSMLANKNAYDVAVHVGKQTNLVRELFNDKTTEGLARYENIQELLNSIKEWVDTQQDLSRIDEEGVLVDENNPESQVVSREGAGLSTYLHQITLLTDQDEKDPNADTVKLMTIHAAKGLEFNCVFAAGLEEMLFPNAMSINTREELEEERRLFYVVVTRTKQKLWISYANSRYRFGSVVQNEPSRFIDEIPAEYLDKSFAGGRSSHQPFPNSFNGRSAFDRMNRGFNSGSQTSESKPGYLPTPKTSTREHIPSPDFVASDVSQLQVGQKIEHQKFGFGEIIKMEGSAHNPVATVRFDFNGEKKIMLNYAKLRIVESDK